MNITNAILTKLFLALGKFSSILTIKQRTALGKKVGGIFRIASKKRFNVAYENVKQSFPEKTEKEWKSIAQQAYENLGITMTEFVTLPYLSKEEIADYITFENFEVVETALKKGKGVIFLTGHYGNWELAAYGLGLLHNITLNIIVKVQSNKTADAIMNGYRELGGNKTVPMRNAARSLIHTIRANGLVAMIVDQAVFGQQDASYPLFFGRPASTYPTPAYMSLKFGTPIIAGYSVRQADGRYIARIEEIETEGLSLDNGGLEILTQRHVSHLEEHIRLVPGQWSWMHRRWKRVPPELKHTI